MMARDDMPSAHGQFQLMDSTEEKRNRSENERLKLRNRSSSGSKPGSDHEQIHSGHFMVSNPHREKKKNKISGVVGFDFQNANKEPSTNYSFVDGISANDIDSSFSKMFECLSLAYNGGRIVSPKWKWFKGLKLSTKDKIRLNNAIWREWHMQFRLCKAPVICQFGSPFAETNHNVAESVVLEGKYWKRTPSTVVHEYNKWRIFMIKQKKHAPGKVDDTEALNHAALVQKMKRDGGEEPMMFEDSFFTDFHDTLFSSLIPPHAFPSSRDIVHMNNSDMIQPGLVQLQPTLEPSLDDFMDTLEPFQDLTRTLGQSNSANPFVFTGCAQSLNLQGIQPTRLDNQLLCVNSLQSDQSAMQTIETRHTTPCLDSDFMNAHMLTNSTPGTFNQQPCGQTSLYQNVHVNNLGQFQSPYPVQISEALSNTSKDDFTASLIKQFHQDEAQLSQVGVTNSNAIEKLQTAPQSATHLMTQQNVTLLNQVAEQTIQLQAQSTVHPQNTLVAQFSTTRDNEQLVQNSQGHVIAGSAVRILRQISEQKPIITRYMKAPLLQPQQQTQQVQFSQQGTSIMLPAVSTHQVLVPLSVSQPSQLAQVVSDVFAMPKSKPPTARRIAPAPPPATSSSSSSVSNTTLLTQLLTTGKDSTSFALSSQGKAGIGNPQSRTVLLPTSILKTEFPANSSCTNTSTHAPIASVSTGCTRDSLCQSSLWQSGLVWASLFQSSLPVNSGQD